MALDPRQTLPTKINLINLRRSLVTINRIRKILEDKREVLLLNIRIALEKYSEIRRRVFEKLEKAYQTYFLTISELGFVTINSMAGSTPKTVEITMGERAAFGIKVPIIEIEEETFQSPLTSFFFTTSQMIRLNNELKDLMIELVKLSELEATINRLLIELRNTQKLINSLDYYIIPLYQNVIKKIRLVLEERSREEFVRLKIMKSKLILRA